MTTDKLEALEREIREWGDSPFSPTGLCLLKWANTLAAIRAEMGGVTEAALDDLHGRCIAAVPMNWCDPLLTGPTKVLPDEADCPTIERLLRAIRERIITLYPTAALNPTTGDRNGL